MSKVHDLGESIPALPENFLNLDQASVAIAAAQTRNMPDLRSGLDGLEANRTLVARTYGGYQREHEEDKRQINRGVALGWLLIEAGMANLPNHGSNIAALIDPDRHEGPRRLFGEAQRNLFEGRELLINAEALSKGQLNNVSDDDVADAVTVFEARTNEVLRKAGLSDHFGRALAGLTGGGLEEPTRHELAKYGAAHLVLSLGATGLHLQ